MTQSVGIFPSPFFAPDAWDTFTINSVPWQGKFEFRGAERHFRWDHKNPPGVDGAYDTFRGTQPQPFDLTVYIWTDQQWNRWTSVFVPLLTYPGAKVGQVFAVTIGHISLSAIGVSACVVLGVGAMEPAGEDKMFKVRVRLKEYKQPPVPINVTATPPGAAAVSPANVPGNVPNPAIQALEQRIAALQQQASNLGTPGGLP